MLPYIFDKNIPADQGVLVKDLLPREYQYKAKYKGHTLFHPAFSGYRDDIVHIYANSRFLIQRDMYHK